MPPDAFPHEGGTHRRSSQSQAAVDAAGAACLTLLSYVATAVISANEAMHYSHNLWSGLDVFLACAVAVARHPGTLIENWRLPPVHSLPHALFYGFAAAMLGISGFESSANFIEEQKEGVFPKTLRNMWISATCFSGDGSAATGPVP